jgi:electron transfer flavoprotein beta subunit
LKILVCITPALDPEAKISLQNGRPAWGAAPLVINPFDELAVEGALRLKDALGAMVAALCVGNPSLHSGQADSARDALKHALAMGVDEAILVSDTMLADLDTQGAARVLAAAAMKVGGVDLIVFGRQTLDHGTGLTPAQTARVLGWPLLSLAGSINVAGANITVERIVDEGRQTARAALPAAVSVTQGIGEPRYPSFVGIRRAAKAVIPVWTLVDLSFSAPAVVVTRLELFAPVRDVACEFIGGDTPEEIADKLADKILAEKILYPAGIP